MPDKSEPTTVLVVDDHALVRKGLCELLSTREDMRVIGEAGDSATTLAVAEARQPDVILLDINIPGDDVATTVCALRRLSPRSRIIILSMYESPELVHTLLAHGVRGYLLKNTRWQELLAAISAIAADSDRVVLGVTRLSLPAATRHEAAERLSPREREVLALVAEALSNRQIAARLSLTEATVKRHLRKIYVKLGAVSRIDAIGKHADAVGRTDAIGKHADAVGSHGVAR